jgi:hypothetical protein
MRVRVNVEATYATKKYAKAAGVKSLLGTLLTGKDPCCGCYIVEFDKPLGTDSVFYTSGKKGYCEEIEPEFITRVKAASKHVPGVFVVGDKVVVTKEYDAAKVGMVGQVIYLGSEVGISFPTLTVTKGGHNLGGRLSGLPKAGTGQWVPSSHLDHAKAKSEPEPVVAPKKSYALALGPGNTVKVLWDLVKDTELPFGGRKIDSAEGYYGWLTVVQDGSITRRVLNAPFADNTWMSFQASDARIANIRPFDS